MKKEILLTTAMLLGLSFNSFAAAGRAKDEFEFLLVMVGLLLFILGLLNSIDYLKKNGKTIINNTRSFLNRKITSIRNYHNKMKSDYFDMAYF
jgi:hypothetical protein